MARRVCAEAGCPLITDSTRCPDHTRAKDKARGTTTQRGYGSQHQGARAAWQRRIDAGEQVTCWRPNCTERITGRTWHLGHDDLDRSITRGPECVRCNLKAAGRISPRAYRGG